MVSIFVNSALDFYNQLKGSDNGRYRSWEHCYSVFYRARKSSSPDIELLCLHLSFYLASWGMYRGSSFLLQRDYLVHRKAVEIILLPEYDKLLGGNIDLLRERIEDLFDLSDKLKKEYSNIRTSVCVEMKEKVPKMKISDTLITKILMGTMGCAPAYDRFFIQGITENRVANGQFNPNSIKKLVNHYKENEMQYEAIRAQMKCDRDIEYPQMKILDMAFWNYAFSKNDWQDKRLIY